MLKDWSTEAACIILNQWCNWSETHSGGKRARGMYKWALLMRRLASLLCLILIRIGTCFQMLLLDRLACPESFLIINWDSICLLMAVQHGIIIWSRLLISVCRRLIMILPRSLLMLLCWVRSTELSRLVKWVPRFIMFWEKDQFVSTIRVWLICYSLWKRIQISTIDIWYSLKRRYCLSTNF